MIKQNCAWCGAKMDNNYSRYVQRGNACEPCSSRFSKILNGVRGLRLDKRGYVQNHKVREFTIPERDEMLLARINEIKKCTSF